MASGFCKSREGEPASFVEESPYPPEAEDAAYPLDLEDMLGLFIEAAISATSALAPRLAVGIDMFTDADPSGEVGTGDEISVTIRFRSMMAPNGEPFTIRVTDGAEILIADINDIEFNANGVSAPVRDVIVGDGVVSFMSGTPATTPLQNEIRFSIKAPPSAGDFKLSVMIGLPSTTPSFLNSVEQTFGAVSSLYVETSDDVITGDMPFDVFGETGFANASGMDYLVGFTLTHKGTNYEADGDVMFTNPDGSFSFDGRTFPGTAPEGTYIVEVTLLDFLNANGPTPIGTAQKEIEYVVPQSSITMSTSHDSVTGDMSFDISGETGRANVSGMDYLVGFTITHKGTSYEADGDVMFTNPDGSFSFDGRAFPDTAPEGTYIVEVTLLDFLNANGPTSIGTAQKEIEYVKSGPGTGLPMSGNRVAAGRDHSLFLNSDGTVWAWGRNDSGQLGDGTTTDRATPAHVLGLDNVVAIASRGSPSFALKSDGTIWAWGANSHGALGDGTTTNRTTPVQVLELDDVVAIAPSLALRSDGTVWAWGPNGAGQLGDGTITSPGTTIPVQILGLDDVVAIAAGNQHSIALKSDGTVWSWGTNTDGFISAGPTTPPVQVFGIDNVVAISLYWGHSLALRSDGTVWAWGLNNRGALGDGTTTFRATPAQVLGINNVVAIASGTHHSIAIQSDGTVWTWGSNSYGLLGDGTIVRESLTPVRVHGLDNVVAIVSGWYHVLALQENDSAVWAWGYNDRGQLGDGTTVGRNTPVQVLGL